MVFLRTYRPSLPPSLPLCFQVDLSLITPGTFRKPVVRLQPVSLILFLHFFLLTSRPVLFLVFLLLLAM